MGPPEGALEFSIQKRDNSQPLTASRPVDCIHRMTQGSIPALGCSYRGNASPTVVGGIRINRNIPCVSTDGMKIRI